ncbi:unnamed protein product [Vicia faba]|uniref:Uncharacterized protein n=1 Tax=Vicia faba TaxID=3906 RepID=A0AAV0YUM0_VICFA|nr:unnamed protein product [Vicia faba]
MKKKLNGGKEVIQLYNYTKSVMTIAFQLAFDVHLQDNIAVMARQYVRSGWLCNSYRFYLGVELLKSEGSVSLASFRFCIMLLSIVLCCSQKPHTAVVMHLQRPPKVSYCDCHRDCGPS